ncbi:hypothetical protein MKW98_008785 [Papaver atlanticum]|uniref:ABC1 atypical kinase-like domain-containing protein n=1 Tax=Papaver atlanticum TaxID=357466 RepID=A0AAD4XRC4_9MAGN|nr:hypothetical protein MKW98_008785 [Papaver atlanticum]
MKARSLLKFPAGGTRKNTFYLITITGLAGLTYQATTPANPNNSPFSNDLVEKIRAGVNGVARSSLAVYTLTSNVVDYKYSLHGLNLDSDEYRSKLSEVHLRSARRVLKLCEANKGFYVKAGQFIAAMRQVPKEYSSTLSSLQNKAVPCNFEAIKKVLTSNLGKDLSEVFLSFDEEPIAAASIAQVHRGILKDHQNVAVKVQYPGLEQQMRIDITTMSFLSKSIAWVFPEYRFDWMVLEFEKAISSELDFAQEAKNSERISKNFKGNSIVKIPHVFWDLTRRQVLTMQFCSGNKVDDLKFLKKCEIDPGKVAKALVEVFAEMIFVHGFLHGDPHPGNIIVSPGGRNGFSLVLLDHGICRELDEQFRLNYCELWNALILLDANKIADLGERFGVGKYARYFPVIFTGRTIDSKSALGRGMTLEEKKILKQELKALNMEDISSFMESLPPDFITILRTDGLLRSVISKLGASQQIRLLTYAKYSVYGLSSKLNPLSGVTEKNFFSSFKATVGFIRLRLVLEVLYLLSWIQDLGRSFLSRIRKILAEAIHLLTRVSSPAVLM